MQNKFFKYSIVLIYILVKSLILYQVSCGLMVSMSGFHPVDPGSNPSSDSKLFYFLFFFLDLAKISQKTEVEIRDASQFFEWILKFWPQGF